MIVKNLDRCLLLTCGVQLAALLDPAARGLLKLTDNMTEDMLYNAAAGMTVSSQSSVDDRDASDVNC